MFGRLAAVSRIITGGSEAVGRYHYDALGRRIRKTVENSGVLDTLGDGECYYYDGHRVIDYRRIVASSSTPTQGGIDNCANDTGTSEESAGTSGGGSPPGGGPVGKSVVSTDGASQSPTKKDSYTDPAVGQYNSGVVQLTKDKVGPGKPVI